LHLGVDMFARCLTVLIVVLAFASCSKNESPTPAVEPAAEDARTAEEARRPRRKRPRAKRPGRDRKDKPDAADRPAVSDGGGTRTVALRFHLLRAPGSKWLHTTIGRPEIEARVAEVNDVWAPAKIRFVIDDVLHEDAIDPAAHDEATQHFLQLKRSAKSRGEAASKKERKAWSPALRAAKKASSAARFAAIPKTQRIDRGIDVFVVGRLPSAGGVFGCPLGGILYSERRKGAEDGLNIGKVLAHELGHGLSLAHTPCGDDENLMMDAGCKQRKPQNAFLDAGQIAAARGVAASGRARPCKRGEDIED
jgi:hypothetical protein